MADETVPPWPWWMAPARFVGRARPGLLAASQADAFVFANLSQVRRALIPVAVICIAAAFAALHMVTSGSEPALPLNWLRLHMDNIFTEVPLFLVTTAVIGALSPAAGVLFVLSFGAFDLIAAAVHPEELHISAIHPVPFLGRIVAYWLLWLLVVEVPVAGRMFALSIRSVARRPAAITAIVGIATGVIAFLWTQGAPVLLRPVYLWSDIGGPYAEGFVPLQNGGPVIAVVAGGAAIAFAMLRGPGRLLYPIPQRPPPTERSPRIVALAVGAARRLINAGLLTVGLGGLITKPIDAAVLFVAVASAGPLAAWVAQRSTIGVIAARVPPSARMAIAMGTVFVVSLILVGIPVLMAVSEFFSIIAVFAVGLFIIGFLAANGPSSSPPLRSSDATPALVIWLALGLLGIGLAAPLPVFADNGSSFTDIWNYIVLAALAGMSIPILAALALGEATWGKYWDAKERVFYTPPPPKPEPPMFGTSGKRNPPWRPGLPPLPRDPDHSTGGKYEGRKHRIGDQ